MFRAAGGGASKFPDLSGDGKVTQKDILIGRGVIEKQEGGGIGAMMAPEDMAMMPDEMPSPMMQEPSMEPLAQDVLMAREEGEKIGLDYLAETMGGIDMAANTEELINAIRGNDRPLEARVAELATFVGESDARQTPESVLTMVQPTIMMTEEGAIDSGVGGLIAQVIGDTEMEADMGQGVGALMAQGQPEPMATPQQFAEGGAVKKFAPGGEATADPGFMSYYNQYLPLFENIVQQDARDRERDRGLALARAGFQLASGRDAKGRNIAGSGFLSNLASAGETLIGDISALDRERRKTDLSVRTLALQSALSTDAAERKIKAEAAERRLDRAKDLAVQQLKNQGKTQIGKFKIDQIGVDSLTNQPIFGYIDSESGAVTKIDDVDAFIGQISRSATQVPKTTASADLPVTTEDAVTPTRDTVRKIFSPGAEGDSEKMTVMLDRIPAFIETGLNETDRNFLSTIIEEYFEPQVGVGGFVQTTKNLSIPVADLLVRASEKTDTPLAINPALLKLAKQKIANPAEQTQNDFEQTINQIEQTLVTEDKDFPAGFKGVRSGLNVLLGKLGEQFEELTELNLSGTEFAGVDFDDSQYTLKARSNAKTLGTVTLKALQERQGTRPLKSITDIIIAEVNVLNEPGALTTRRALLRTAQKIREQLQIVFTEDMRIANAPKGTVDEKDIIPARQDAIATKVLLDAYDNLINQLNVSIGDVKDEGPTAVTTDQTETVDLKAVEESMFGSQ